MTRLRLDKALVERGLVSTRARAQERIAHGDVIVGGVTAMRPALAVSADATIELRGDGPPYVSRGGVKLAAALDQWKIEVARRTCVDVGISTGGFTDCLLQRGAALVVGIDSGHGQVAKALRGEPRLLLMESTNARYLEPSALPAGISLFVMDVSFIAASLVLPAVIAAAFPASIAGALAKKDDQKREAVILVKPQFEAGREYVGKRGLVRSDAAHERSIRRVEETVRAHGARETAVTDSPIPGGDGNREFLLYARF